MSSQSEAVSRRHFEYLAARTTPEDTFLAELKTAAATAGLPQIWISPEQASFMQVLLRLCGAREVVEVGTLAGYSALWMARALPEGGRVRTVELEPKHADFAEEWIGRSDVAGRVEVHRGDAGEVLAGFADGSADACFIDADKDGYRTYLDACLRIVRPGGLIMVDNAFAFGCLFDDGERGQDVQAIRDFNDHMAACAEVDAIIAPFGDGCWVGVRR